MHGPTSVGLMFDAMRQRFQQGNSQQNMERPADAPSEQLNPLNRLEDVMTESLERNLDAARGPRALI